VLRCLLGLRESFVVGHLTHLHTHHTPNCIFCGEPLQHLLDRAILGGLVSVDAFIAVVVARVDEVDILVRLALCYKDLTFSRFNFFSYHFF
jgi:hypothetical protein